MNQNSLETPVTNRGVECPEIDNFFLDLKGQVNDLEQFIIIDWFQFTIFPDFNITDVDINGVVDGYRLHIFEYFKKLFNIERQDVIIEEKGLNGYDTTYSFRNIKMMTNRKRKEMGINVLMSGQGCRDYEELNIGWYNLFLLLNGMTISYNRIDIAIDDYTNKYFTLTKLKKYKNKGLISSKFYNVLSINKSNIESGLSVGDTLQFGSKASEVQITFYDKLLERESQNYIVNNNIKYWTRCEVRFRHSKAKDIVNILLNNNNDLNTTIKGVLHDYIRFLIKSDTDSRKRRWDTTKWWLDYLENIDKLKLTTKNPERTITRKKAWIDKSVSKTYLQVLISTLGNIELDNHSSEFMKNVLVNGIENITDKDVEIINEYRISNKLIPITKGQLYDYIRDIKDILIISDNRYLD